MIATARIAAATQTFAFGAFVLVQHRISLYYVYF